MIAANQTCDEWGEYLWQSAKTRRLDIEWEQKACILPAYRSGTHEWYRRIAAESERSGNIAKARMMRDVAERQERRVSEQVLGVNPYLAINAAYFLAASLRSRTRTPRGAQKWMAQHALEDWLPAMPAGERREIVTILRGCRPQRLTPRLLEIMNSTPSAACC